METKTAVDWKKGVNDIVNALGKPKIIMADPDSSITSNELDEWFRNSKDVQHVMTRRHAVFAESHPLLQEENKPECEQRGEAVK